MELKKIFLPPVPYLTLTFYIPESFFFISIVDGLYEFFLNILGEGFQRKIKSFGEDCTELVPEGV